jgi:hypothetical protein
VVLRTRFARGDPTSSACENCAMRLEPLYRIRFTYPEQWGVELGGEWEQHFALAEGRCEGTPSAGVFEERTSRDGEATGPSGLTSER